MRAALIAARVRSVGQDPAAIATAQRVMQPEAVVVSPAGERSGSRGVARFLPVACGVLMFFGVITGGQALMTSTVEEKSNRVIEVLLAAVSPLELMYGKLLGQLGLGLTMTAVYLVMAMFALAQYSLAGLLDPMLILYVFAFFIVTFLVFGSLMLTIGSAVNQMAEAQALMGPVIILLVGELQPVGHHRPGAQFHVQRRDELHSAGQYLRHDRARRIQRSAAGLGGVDDLADQLRDFRAGDLDCRQGVQDRTTHAWQTAEHRDPVQVGADGLKQRAATAVHCARAPSSPLSAARSVTHCVAAVRPARRVS